MAKNNFEEELARKRALRKITVPTVSDEPEEEIIEDETPATVDPAPENSPEEKTQPSETPSTSHLQPTKDSPSEEAEEDEDDEDGYERKTYYLTKLQVEGIEVKRFEEFKDISQIVREAIDAYVMDEETTKKAQRRLDARNKKAKKKKKKK